MRTILTALFLAAPLLAQSNRGEFRLTLTDPAGFGVKATVQITSEANQYRNSLVTSDDGILHVQRLSYGTYQVAIEQPGFAPVLESVDIRSSIPTDYAIRLKLAEVKESVTVKSEGTLLDPDRAGSVNEIGSETIQRRLTSLPGRSIQDLVNTQPGWIYEGNAVLHPRGSEYQTQFVVDAIPLTDNRSPSFGPEIGANDVDSMTIFTAGFPAEYGRKMGGVVEVNTSHDPQPGFHGQVVLSGGSYDSAGMFAMGQFTWGKNAFGFTASGARTNHYLNPVVPENYTNSGTLGDFSVNYERDLTTDDRLNVIARYALSRYQLPNEIVQQTWCYPPGVVTGPPCQQQNANNFEPMLIANYRHIFSPNMVGNFSGMVRNNSNAFYSNALSTPIILSQHNWFNELYFKGMVTIDHGPNEWKIGVESDNTFLHENFNYVITDPSQFDEGTALTFSFPGAYPSQGQRPDLEQSAFVQDLIRLGNWTMNLGLRWDHYQLIVNKQAVQPRLAISYYFPSLGLIAHFSYDRVFQTPSFENILLSSSFEANLINPDFLHLPVEPSQGNYFEAGASRDFNNNLRLDVNYYLRNVNNYADDDQIQNTTISFPISFQKAIIYGAEAKIEVPNWHHISGFASYSYMVGNAWFPVTGGLFLGQNVQAAEKQLGGHFPGSQDQRNTLFTRWMYQVKPRFWVAGGIQYANRADADPSAPGSWPPFPIAGVLLTSADIDQIAGLLCLRELQFFRIYCTPSFRRILQEDNSVFGMLNRVPQQVCWMEVKAGTNFPLLTINGKESGVCGEILSLGNRYPVYVSPERAATLKPEEAVLGLLVTASSGRRLAYVPAVPAINERLLQLLDTTDLVLFDGTFWSDDELIQVQGSGPTAREMGHVPVSGADGSLRALVGLRRPRKVFVHVNNTNPTLDDSGPERRELQAAGWEIAEDGWHFNL